MGKKISFIETVIFLGIVFLPPLGIAFGVKHLENKEKEKEKGK